MSKSALPLVSVCIPTYNGGKYIRHAIESALSQSYKNIEIIISDDGSEDNTMKIVTEIRKQTTTEFRVYNHIRSSIAANWNYAIKMAKGKYIKPLFQDDFMNKECIDTMVTILEKYEDVGLTACKRKFLIDYESIKEREREKKWIAKFGDLQRNIHMTQVGGLEMMDKKVFKQLNFWLSPMNKVGEPTAVLFRKDLLSKIGLFSDQFRQFTDVEFFYRVINDSRVLIINEELVTFRLHEQQLSKVNERKGIKEGNKLIKLVMFRYFKHLSFLDRIRFLKIYII